MHLPWTASSCRAVRARAGSALPGIAHCAGCERREAPAKRARRTRRAAKPAGEWRQLRSLPTAGHRGRSAGPRPPTRDPPDQGDQGTGGWTAPGDWQRQRQGRHPRWPQATLEACGGAPDPAHRRWWRGSVADQPAGQAEECTAPWSAWPGGQVVSCDRANAPPGAADLAHGAALEAVLGKQVVWCAPWHAQPPVSRARSRTCGGTLCGSAAAPRTGSRLRLRRCVPGRRAWLPHKTLCGAWQTAPVQAVLPVRASKAPPACMVLQRPGRPGQPPCGQRACPQGQGLGPVAPPSAACKATCLGWIAVRTAGLDPLTGSGPRRQHGRTRCAPAWGQVPAAPRSTGQGGSMGPVLSLCASTGRPDSRILASQAPLGPSLWASQPSSRSRVHQGPHPHQRQERLGKPLPGMAGLLRDKVVLITGASRGIGRVRSLPCGRCSEPCSGHSWTGAVQAIAEAYAAEGAFLVLTARSAPDLEEVRTGNLLQACQ